MSKQSPLSRPSSPKVVYKMAAINTGAALKYHLSTTSENNPYVEHITRELKEQNEEQLLAQKLMIDDTFSDELADAVFKRHQLYAQRGWFDDEFETLARVEAELGRELPET